MIGVSEQTDIAKPYHRVKIVILFDLLGACVYCKTEWFPRQLLQLFCVFQALKFYIRFLKVCFLAKTTCCGHVCKTILLRENIVLFINKY